MALTCLGSHGSERSKVPGAVSSVIGLEWGLLEESGVCPRRPDSARSPARVSRLRGKGARGGLGAGKARGQRPWPQRWGRRARRPTPGAGRAERARRWSAPGCGARPRRPSPQARRPRPRPRRRPRPRPLPPAPRRLRARRTWRRRRCGRTPYLSTGPTACAGTAASSSSSAARGRGRAGTRAGGAGPGGRRPGRRRC